MAGNAIGLAGLLLTFATTLYAQDSQSRVLIVFGHNPNSPAAVIFDQTLRQPFIEDGTHAVEFFSEAIDYDRFPDRKRWSALATSFAAKYRDVHPTAIVAEGSAGLLFCVEFLRPHFPDVPIVYALTFDPIVDYSRLPPNVTGRRLIPGFAQTLELAKQLQPDAERVVLVGGSSTLDSVLFDFGITELQRDLGGLELVPVQNWTYPSLMRSLEAFPDRTIIILSTFRRDLAGYAFISGDLIASLTNIASAPVYGLANNWVKDGIVGGSVFDFANEGRETARLLRNVLRRSPGQPFPPAEIATNPRIVDWRQLQRWSLPESRLPPGTLVLFRAPTLWEKHRTLIIATVGVLVVQLTLIVLLLLERRRRQRAQRTVAQTHEQVTHIARVATAGQITAAVSHELRQPLTAIHAWTQTGKLLLAEPNPDLNEIREIFGTIALANERAVELIDHIRALLRNHEEQRELVDLNHVARRCMQLMQLEAARRQVRLDTHLDPAVSPVPGYAVQLQQVCINLIMNAMDAAGNSSDGRSVVLGTREGATEVEVYVHNTGAQLSTDMQIHIFDAFYSTKPDGLGMGLAIVRIIVDRHHGVVRGSNHPDGGVVFSVLLPKAK